MKGRREKETDGERSRVGGRMRGKKATRLKPFWQPIAR